MSPALKAYYIMRYLGPRILWLRGGVYLRKRLGTTAKIFRPRPWNKIDLNAIVQPGIPTDPHGYADYKKTHVPEFLFPLGCPPAMPKSIVDAKLERQLPFDERLRLLQEDRCVYFFKIPSPARIDWYFNPLDNKRSDPTKLWCDLPDFAPEQGDMRLMWEPSRATWAIDLGRAKSWNMPVDAAELFWKWLDSWMAACPPYMGFQWKCGQESSVRFFAVAFGFWALADDPATTPERWVQFARLAWATGYRVAHHINYAISQKNNHALSEAMGLMLISRLFPEFRESASWWATGRRVLGTEIHRQVAPDGTYLQSSMNYQRVMLHVCMLGLRLAELAGEPLERDVYDILDRANEFVFQTMDASTGRLPNYGPNDGAYVLPLSECDFTDYRPMLQAVHYLVHRRRMLPPGPWDEDLLWLFGQEALDSAQSPPCTPTSSAFGTGGYYTLRRDNSWMMTRCHTYNDRPAQCDQLHVDFWWRGFNILCDCGSYHYYTPGNRDLEYYFKSIAAHNNVEIDGANPLQLASRFMWFPWPRAAIRQFCVDGAGPIVFEGEYYDYDRKPWHVLHRRTVVSLSDELWVVIDDVLGRDRHRAILRWHTIDVPYQIDPHQKSVTLRTSAGPFSLAIVAEPGGPHRFELIRGRNEPGRVQGFAAPYYGELQAIPTLEVEFDGLLPRRILTILHGGEPVFPRLINRIIDAERWVIHAESDWTLTLARPDRTSSKTFLDHARG